MKKNIITAAIIAAFMLPSQALASGAPTFDLQAHLDNLTHTQIYQDMLNLQNSAQKLQDTIMKKIQDMTGVDKTVQASKDATIKAIDANSPKTIADIDKKIRDMDHNVDSYKTPDEQAADLTRIKADQYKLDKQCGQQKSDILKAKNKAAHEYSDFLKSLGGKDTTEYKKNEGKIKSYEAAIAAYTSDLEQVTEECDKQAKLLEEEYRVSTQASVIGYEQKLEKDTEDSNEYYKKKAEEMKNYKGTDK